MFGHKPYYVLADQLTKNGIGVLRFDERGVGVSEGNFETASIKELSTDVTSAIAYLKSRNDINVSKIGLIGHSIGGIIAPKVATESNDIGYIVLLAAPGVNGDELMLSQKAAMERIMGFNEIQIAQSSTLVKGAYNIIVNSNLDNTSLKDSLNSHYINTYGKMIPDNQRKSLVDQITNYEVVSLIKSKPSEYLEQVKCPVLALNGSKDFQVPATENLKAIKNAVEKNGNKNVSTVAFENLNHLFQECETGASSEYSEIEETMSFGALDLITAWIKEQTD
jgi:alpha/beta superfamily hydrolase